MAKKIANPVKRQVALAESYRAVFMGPAGEMVLHDLMSKHGMLSNSYNGNVNDMLIKEGERLVVLRILKMLNVDIKKLRERIEDYEKSLAE